MVDEDRDARGFEELRRRAKALLEERFADSSQYSAETLELIQELRLHQTELSLQNEELKRAQQELSRLHQEYEDLYEFAPCGYLLLSPQGIITRINLTGVGLLGAERSKLTRRAMSAFVARESQGTYFSALERAILEPQSEELELIREDGSHLWVRADIQADSGQASAVGQWRLTLQDITEKKRAEEEMARAKEQAEEANKAKSHFLAKMSHEIRTPINSVLGMLRLATFDELPQKQLERIQVAKQSAESFLWLINDLLDHSRIESGRFSLHQKIFRPRKLLGNVIKEMQLQASEKGLDLSWSVQETVPSELIGDPHRLKQVLINLMSNAVKFTQQGRVELRAETCSLSPDWEGEDPELCCMLFSVEDTGPGIGQDSLTSIFDSYEQGGGDPLAATKGSGLGLSICKKLVEEMGGSIWARSQLGEGSVFWVRIPFRREGVREETTPEEPEEEEGDIPSLRVLLVEDERMNQIFTQDLLQSHGHSCDIADDGESALVELSRRSYDLVLMDLLLPGMDGIETAMRIRTADPVLMNPEIPIIGLSAHAATEEEIQRYQRTGFNDFLVKPVNFENLFQAMKKAAKDTGSGKALIQGSKG